NSFYTQLENTFVLLEQPNSNTSNNSELLRTNGSDSKVWGLTAEARVNYNYKVECDVGVTYQQSTYQEPVSWSSEIPGTTKFLRTPQYYGYITTGFNPGKRLKISVSGVYTGMMLVPHFAGAPGVLEDQLVHSPDFMEINLKSEYQFKLKAKLPGISVSFGVQNLLDQFQQDFDTGPSRDSNYIYGPGRPRTYFIALKLYSSAKSSD
ncbi:MAG TPA: TonB-dependent receptor, partial [Bacteroidia bacterium]|nr:TonB-dependent receptor [Bacteroidia bacterium]